ncbi:MAG: hypothetical protein AB1847_12995 [bacterium]
MHGSLCAILFQADKTDGASYHSESLEWPPRQILNGERQVEKDEF